MGISLLTEDEVAAILRRKKSAVTRLRLSRQLPFLPGRTPTVDASDLDAWIESRKIRPKAAPVEESAAEIAADAREWALKQKLKPARKRSAIK